MSNVNVINSRSSSLVSNIKELWEYRELLWVLVWRDLKVRYRQTVLGATWAIFQPSITSIIFSVFFGKLAKIPSDGLPYILFSYIGLWYWTFFSNAVSTASNSTITMAGVYTKVYFPRIILPLSAILTTLVDMLIGVIPLILMLIYFHLVPSLGLFLLLPLFFIILLLTTAGLGIFFAAINVQYRDVRYILPFFIQIGIFLTPVIYPVSVLFDIRRWLLYLNPLTAVIEGTRGALLGKSVDPLMLLLAIVMSFGLFVIALYYYQNVESYFADIV